ncbi:MAG TPA: M1 family metallopeptidase [Kofleriaceae bacterium]|nr:M1 family metallopeptidase [Kofleriaceae bacterium]
MARAMPLRVGTLALALVVAGACRTPPPAPAQVGPAAVRSPAHAAPRPAAGRDAGNARLPRTFAIARASLDLAIDPDRGTLGGTVRFEGAMEETGTLVWLDAVDLRVTRARATPLDHGAGATPIPLEIQTFEPAVGRVVLHAPAPLPAGAAYALELDYTARVEDPFDDYDTRGTFRQRLDGRWYVFTQHEPTDARRSFPCIDEPDVKIPWTVTLTVPAGLTALANAPATSTTATTDGHTRVAFAPTEPLPSYLVAYAVGPFDLVPAGTSSGGAPIRIVTPAGGAADAAFAAESTGKLLASLERWTGIPYPFAKLDLVAVPEPRGFWAMENAGLVTMGWRSFLQPSTAEHRASFLHVTAHELAHMWFGDLVTPAWWDDLWLNESLASWLEPAIVADAYPRYASPEDGEELRLYALRDDEHRASALRHPIDDDRALEDDPDLGEPLYGKGAAVVRMLEAWIGPVRFHEALRAYLADHARGNVRTRDLAAALEAHSTATKVERVIDSFLDEAGAPGVVAEVDCTRTGPAVFVAASPPRGHDQRWRIPICVIAGDQHGAQRVCGTLTPRKPRQLLRLASCPTWVWPNADGAGYYRSLLWPDLWRSLADDGWKQLDAGERLAAFDDLPESTDDLARLPWVSRLAAEGNSAATSRAAEVLSAATRWSDAAMRQRLRTRIDALFGARVRALGWLPRPGDSLDDARTRSSLVPLFALLGDASLGREAVTLSAHWRLLPADLRATVLQAAVRTDPTVFDRLRTEAESDVEAGRTIGPALGAVHDRDRLLAAIALAGAPTSRFSLVSVLATADREAALPDVVVDFVLTHVDELRRQGSPFTELAEALGTGCDPAVVAALHAAAIQQLGQQLGSAQVRDAFASFMRCPEERPREAAEVEAWLAGSP